MGWRCVKNGTLYSEVTMSPSISTARRKRSSFCSICAPGSRPVSQWESVLHNTPSNQANCS